MEEKRVILNKKEMERMLVRMAYEILEKVIDTKSFAIVGVYTRGAYIAGRIKKIMDDISGNNFPLGEIDINLYRDDWTRISIQPEVKKSRIPFSVDDKEILLVDDVIYTGRTTRAAIDALLDFGRPKKILLAALIDRDYRELPIQPDVTGKFIETAQSERVNVFVSEVDGEDKIFIAGEQR